jgi:large subunit ribosomal protein L24
VQTTLLGFAIAIILALVTALAAPLFVDWGRFRGEFETRATGLTGLEFKVTGPIDARLLPTPTLVLRGIEFGRSGEGSRVRARTLRLEFALGALVRGEWKISDARLEAPELVAGLDDSGHVALPVPSIDFNVEGVSIQRLTIEDGRATLVDAASAARLVLSKLEFRGELRSLAGPIKGEGSFVAGGQHYPYRIFTNHVSDDGTLRVRLAVDPIDRPLTAEADISISLDRGKPRFEGKLTFARPVGRAPNGAAGLIVEPWRVTSRIKGDGAAAVLEKIEFQYGPDERPIKLRGDARLTFGARPRLEGVFSSPQIDLDRVLALPEAASRRPLIAVKSLAEHVSGAYRLPFPVRLGINVEALTFAGATLQRLSADVKSDGDGWDIENLDLRAPGITQVRLSGRLGVGPAGIAFDGPAQVESADPRAFVAWLADRADVPFSASGPLRLAGNVKLSGEAVAVDRLQVALDRMSVAGHFAYAWTNGDRPARLDAALTAPELDLDRLHALGRAVLGDTDFDWPHEGGLSLKVEHAVLAGVDAKGADINVRIDANGYGIERLTIADFGGASLAARGRIDNHKQTPRGEVTLDLDARSLDGVLALVEKFAPAAAEPLRRRAEQFAPLKLRALLAVDPSSSKAVGVTQAQARFKIDGRAGVFRVALQGDAQTPAQALALPNLASLRAAQANVSGHLDADDGTVLIELAGLDPVLAVDKRPARLALAAKGSLASALALDGRLAMGTLEIAGKGTVRFVDGQSPSAGLELKIANANVRSPRPAAGRAAELLPLSATARLALADGTVTLTDLAGSIAGTRIGGRLSIGVQKPVRVAGDIELDAFDLASVIAAALGMPAQDARAAGPWPAEPFEAGLPHWLTGEVTFKSARATLAPKLAARDVQGRVQFGASELAVREFGGRIAGGRVGGELVFERGAEGIAAHGRLQLSAANAAELPPGAASLAGRLTLDLAISGSGMSPVALVGSLGGGGTFRLENGHLARLDPRAFDAVIRAVDEGLPIDAARVRDRMEAALAGGNLAITSVEGAITVSAGRARLSNTVVRAEGADLAVSGSLNLVDAAIDARLTLSGARGTGGATVGRPEVVVMLKGPLDAPTRTIDAAALASWLALRAVEQQSNKLDALEGSAAPVTPVVPVAPVVPTAPVPPAGASTRVAPSAVVPVPLPLPRVAPAAPGGSATKPAEPAVVRAAPETAEPKVEKPVRPAQRIKRKVQPPRTATAPSNDQPLDLRPAPRAQNNGWPALFQWPQP